MHERLRRVYDVERLLARVTTGRASPRDLEFPGHARCRRQAAGSCGTASKLHRAGETPAAEAAGCSWKRRSICVPSCGRRSTRRWPTSARLASRDGGFIRDGFSAELDALRELARGGKQWIARYQAQETERTRHPDA